MAYDYDITIGRMLIECNSDSCHPVRLESTTNAVMQTAARTDIRRNVVGDARMVRLYSETYFKRRV